MEPSDFYAVADYLGGAPGPSDFMTRSAVSRLYYGSHHEVRVYLSALNVDLPANGRAHREAVRALHARGDGAAAEALMSLLQSRQHADYDLSRAWPPAALEEARADVRIVRRLVGSA